MIRRRLQLGARLVASLAALAFAAPGSAGSAAAATVPSAPLPTLDIAVFAAPSQSVWLPTLIQKAGLDTKHGFQLHVTPKPGPVAYAEFASGADPVCYCAAPSAVARFVEQGSDIALLWNIFNLDFLIASKDAGIHKSTDLAGKTVGADTGTGSWAVSAMLLQEHGLDLKSVKLQSAHGAELVAELAADRIDAGVVQPVDAATLATQRPNTYHIFSIFDKATWHKYASSPGVPSIAFGVWRSWLKDPAHVDLARRLYAANLDAAALVASDPERAATLIASGTTISKDALLYAFRTYPNIIDVRPIDQYKSAVKVLTQKLLPDAKQLDRPMTDAELDAYVSDFHP